MFGQKVSINNRDNVDPALNLIRGLAFLQDKRTLSSPNRYEVYPDNLPQPSQPDPRLFEQVYSSLCCSICHFALSARVSISLLKEVGKKKIQGKKKKKNRKQNKQVQTLQLSIVILLTKRSLQRLCLCVSTCSNLLVFMWKGQFAVNKP